MRYNSLKFRSRVYMACYLVYSTSIVLLSLLNGFLFSSHFIHFLFMCLAVMLVVG